MEKSSSTKGGRNRVKITDLAATETKLTGKEMKEVKGGLATGIAKVGLGVVAGVEAPKPVSGRPE